MSRRLAIGSEKRHPVAEVPKAPLPHTTVECGDTLWPPYWSGGGGGESGLGGGAKHGDDRSGVDSQESDVSGQNGSGNGVGGDGVGGVGGCGHHNGRQP
jgi:hypothetical protein